MKNSTVWLISGGLFVIVILAIFFTISRIDNRFEETIEDNQELVEPDLEDSGQGDDETSSEETGVEYTIHRGDSLASIANETGVTVQELQEWNGILDPTTELEEGDTLSLYGPSEEQAQKEDWQIEFEQELYDKYEVTVSEYEEIDDGQYNIFVNEEASGEPFVTVDSNIGEYER